MDAASCCFGVLLTQWLALVYVIKFVRPDVKPAFSQSFLDRVAANHQWIKGLVSSMHCNGIGQISSMKQLAGFFVLLFARFGHHHFHMDFSALPMKANTNQQLATSTLIGSMPLPRHRGTVDAISIAHEQVDYLALQFGICGVQAGVVFAPLVFDGLLPVCENVD